MGIFSGYEAVMIGRKKRQNLNAVLPLENLILLYADIIKVNIRCSIAI
jgi:hypothetical protein